MAALRDQSIDISLDSKVELHLLWYVNPLDPNVDVAVYFDLNPAYKAVLDSPPVTVFNNSEGRMETTYTFREVPYNTLSAFLYFEGKVSGKAHQVTVQFIGGASQAKTIAV